MSRGLKEADDDNADMTNRNRIQGRRDVGNRAMDRDARTHPERHGGRSGVARVKRSGNRRLPRDEWLRHKLRCLRLKQCRRRYATAKLLTGAGVPAKRAWLAALSGKGWWRRSHSPPVQEGLSLRWFTAQGLIGLLEQYVAFQR